MGFINKVIFLSIQYHYLHSFQFIRFFRTKNTPGNDYIFLSALCSIITLPMLFGSYPLSIVTWIGGLVLYFIGSKKNHEANDDSDPTFYFIIVTFGALIAVFLLLLNA